MQHVQVQKEVTIEFLIRAAKLRSLNRSMGAIVEILANNISSSELEALGFLIATLSNPFPSDNFGTYVEFKVSLTHLLKLNRALGNITQSLSRCSVEYEKELYAIGALIEYLNEDDVLLVHE